MQDSGLYHKTFYNRKKSVMYKASVFVIVINFLLALTNTLALHSTELITATKSFMIQANGGQCNIQFNFYFTQIIGNFYPGKTF